MAELSTRYLLAETVSTLMGYLMMSRLSQCSRGWLGLSTEGSTRMRLLTGGADEHTGVLLTDVLAETYAGQKLAGIWALSRLKGLAGAVDRGFHQEGHLAGGADGNSVV